MEKNKKIDVQDKIDWLYRRGKYEYGTPEYWIKERKSKFRINAREKDEKERNFYSNIVNLWSLQPKVEMPLYKMLSGSKHTVRLSGGPLVYVCQDTPVQSGRDWVYTVKLIPDKDEEKPTKTRSDNSE